MIYYLLVIIKLILFVLSNIGIWKYLYKRKINIYFIPSLTIAIQVSFLFVAGLLNMLKEMTFLLYLAGIILFLFYFYKERRCDKYFINIGYIYLVIIMAVMLFIVRGNVFSHYDNFSHWALVVKNMLSFDRFPNFQDTIIVFQQYPLGSSIYIYFFSKLTSQSESFWMLAQIYMIVTCILPAFSFQKKNKLASTILIFIVSIFFFTYNIKIYDLLVDTLLPIVAMCMFLYVYRYCMKMNNLFAAYATSFYFVWISQIKNSSIFFVIIAIAWILIKIKDDKKIMQRSLVASIPLISMFLWKKHCQYVFASATTSKHAMTMENYQNVLEGKTIEDIETIIISLFKFSYTYLDVLVVFSVIIVTCLLVLWIYKKNYSKKYVLNLLGCAIGLYVLYQLGMLVMYLFSMPLDEAIRLAGVERYTKTILIAIIYILLIVYMKIISDVESKNVKNYFIVSLVFTNIIGMQLLIGDNLTLLLSNKESSKERIWFENVTKKYLVPNDSSYCVLKDYNDGGYSHFLGRFIFKNINCYSLAVSNMKELENISSKYIYVYSSDNPIIKEWIEKNYPDQVGNEVIITGE